MIERGERDATAHANALAHQLLERHGVLTREAVMNESIEGGFSKIYPVLKILEERGRVRRGYFVDGLGPSQFRLPGAEDRLRREAEEERNHGLSRIRSRQCLWCCPPVA